MKARIILLLALALMFLAPSAALAQTIGPTCSVSWNAVTTNADGTPLTSPIIEYRIYRQSTATPPPALGSATVARPAAPATSWNCSGILGAGQHFVWATAFNGVEAALSTNSTAVPPVAAVPLVFTLVVTPPDSPKGLKATP